jgi:hypothetical protein
MAYFSSKQSILRNTLYKNGHFYRHLHQKHTNKTITFQY